MTYLGELREHIRPLAAASLGSGTGLSLTAYTATVFAPHLLRQFGWSRAQFALVGLTMFVTVAAFPVVGRLTDRLGVRPVALVGTLLLPVCFFSYSQMQGSFAFFLFLSASVIATGSMTSTVVYSRLIAENFKQARGLAFTLMNCAPGFIAIGGIPLLNWEILRFGWRDAYVSFGAFVLVCGLIAVALIPNHKMSRSAFESQENEPAAPPVSKTRQSAKAEFRAILLRPVFWVIVAAIFLITLQTPLHAVQMNIMLFDQVKSTQIAANMASIYVFGTITGRLSCGLALDRYSTPGVSALSMVLPAIGFFLLALSLHSIPVVVFSMFLVGVSVGAENDLCPFLVARYFRLDNYSFTLSLIQGTSLIAAATGAAATSLTLKLANSYVPYLYIISFTTLIGSMLFLFLPGLPEGSIANSDSKSDA